MQSNGIRPWQLGRVMFGSGLGFGPGVHVKGIKGTGAGTVRAFAIAIASAAGGVSTNAGRRGRDLHVQPNAQRPQNRQKHRQSSTTSTPSPSPTKEAAHEIVRAIEREAMLTQIPQPGLQTLFTYLTTQTPSSASQS
ncbi:hypothetical protein DID88_000981 [Monilinia fructigena]|uniref:Uncharacterized protein n=1 Tax=Monilinia fructigena TaxID=38457 RepID=A0A395J144_9HELO|nr:hypothetical protein DID88_000981 [Monilinia fructigena]